MTDVKHQVVAVGSRSAESAAKFVDSVWSKAGVTEGKDEVKQYSSYDEFFRDSVRPSLSPLSCSRGPHADLRLLPPQDVDCVYVGSPHSHHYAHVHAALSAGKNVLCEKSLTVNAPQAAALIQLARDKNLFFMEAVWTRFQPYSYKLQEVVRSGAIGDVVAVQAELCADFTSQSDEHRLRNPYLAGGALLDLGVRPLSSSTSRTGRTAASERALTAFPPAALPLDPARPPAPPAVQGLDRPAPCPQDRRLGPQDVDGRRQLGRRRALVPAARRPPRPRHAHDGPGPPDGAPPLRLRPGHQGLPRGRLPAVPPARLHLLRVRVDRAGRRPDGRADTERDVRV